MPLLDEAVSLPIGLHLVVPADLHHILVPLRIRVPIYVKPSTVQLPSLITTLLQAEEVPPSAVGIRLIVVVLKHGRCFKLAEFQSV